MRIPFVDEQPKEQNEAAVTKWLEDMYKAGDQVRRQYEPGWHTNSEFLKGNQWVTAETSNVTRVSMIRTSAPNAKAKVTSNQILPLFRKGVSSLVENFATQIAIASSSDQADKDAAELATSFLRSRMAIDDEQSLRLREMMAVMLFGRVLRKTTWNPNKSAIGIDNQPLNNVGDIETTFLDPSEFVQCPWDKGSSKPTWIIEARIRDVDEINQLFPGHDVQEEEVSTSQFGSKRASDTLFARGATPKPKRAAMLKQLFIRGDDETPAGKYEVWANHKLLYDGSLPDSIFPFTCIDWLPLPLEPYPMSFIASLLPMQRERNITLSQLIEVKNRQLRGDIAIKGGRGENDVILETMSNGQKVMRIDPSVIDYQFLDYAARTTDAEMLLGTFWSDMMQTCGIHESSLGQQSKSNVTATQVLTLKESDLSGLGLFRTGFDLAYCDVSAIKLQLAHDHYQMPRLLKVTGGNEEAKVKAFVGADLRSTQDVTTQTVPLVSETLKNQMRQEAVASGAFGPYQGSQDKLAKLMALMNSGIPDIETDVKDILGGITLDDLQQQVYEIENKQAVLLDISLTLQIEQTQAQIMQLQQMMNPQQQAVPLDQNGEPVQPSMQESAEQQMMDQQAQAQPQPQQGQAQAA